MVVASRRALIIEMGVGPRQLIDMIKNWGSSLRLALVKNCQRSNVDLTPN